MRTWPEREDRASWEDKLGHLSHDQVIWLAPWMRKRNVLYKCGKYPWLPLIGLHGVVAFAPIMFMRQMGTEQFAPEIPEMMSFDFNIKSSSSRKRVIEVRDEWRKPYWIIARWHTYIVSPEYERWIATRGKPLTTCKPNAQISATNLTDVERQEVEFEKERLIVKVELDECKRERDEAIMDARERSQAVDREKSEHELTKQKLIDCQNEIQHGKLRFLRMTGLKNQLQKEVNERKRDNQTLHEMYSESQTLVQEKEHQIAELHSQLKESRQYLESTVETLQAELAIMRSQLEGGTNKKPRTNL